MLTPNQIEKLLLCEHLITQITLSPEYSELVSGDFHPDLNLSDALQAISECIDACTPDTSPDTSPEPYPIWVDLFGEEGLAEPPQLSTDFVGLSPKDVEFFLAQGVYDNA